ncbi:hypothetical protein [Streptomyces sp. AC495_CC817]|uniref:hypothetical protein n=1 Tax=Streptomyces sp. AC495_CC817 TaxID=2823900 RepID=UPI001C25B17B|nr:hypothetical protein [Streptomyces sp. AC495_CC817]
MTEPQVWTMMSVFAALMFGMLAVVSTLFVRILRSEVGGLRNEMVAEFRGVRAEFDGQLGQLRTEFGQLRTEMHGELGQLRTEFGQLRTEMHGELGQLRTEMRGELGQLRTEMQAGFARIDGLDRDVQALVKHTFGMERE